MLVPIMSAWILDRFFTNYWRRDSFKTPHFFSITGSQSTGSDFVDGLAPGPLSVKFYDACARFSGRLTILGLNVLIFTMCHTFMAWLQESPLAKLVDMRDCKAANLRIHR
eukprot:11542940-Heterocapsa_arctica.AAC.1